MCYINIEKSGYSFGFYNNSRDTRHGFAHECNLRISDGEQIRIIDATCHYLNRTWECYHFQSVMLQAVSIAVENRQYVLKEQYKREHGLKRLTGNTHKQVLDAIYTNDEYLQALDACKHELKEKR